MLNSWASKKNAFAWDAFEIAAPNSLQDSCRIWLHENAKTCQVVLDSPGDIEYNSNRIWDATIPFNMDLNAFYVYLKFINNQLTMNECLILSFSSSSFSKIKGPVDTWYTFVSSIVDLFFLELGHALLDGHSHAEGLLFARQTLRTQWK